jgi:tetratricopeptide (TPR) repeat protein
MKAVFRNGMIILRFATVGLVIAATMACGATRLDQALDLIRKGQTGAGRDLLLHALPELRTARDHGPLATALTAASQASVSLGDYRLAIEEAAEAIQIRRLLKDDGGASEDFNTRGLAWQYLGDYPAALADYQEALAIDRTFGDAEGEITRLNNIANIYYFEGRYLDALHSYQNALAKVERHSAEPFGEYRKRLTVANLAALYQRLGQEQEALELYRQLSKMSQSMPAHEQAQLLLNQGVLCRRMGDPVKALDLYAAAQALFSKSGHRDGEVGAWRNIGIARAVDLRDLPGALAAFTAALNLARQSSNARGIVQAELYRAEVFRRMHRLPEAGRDADAALDGAAKAGLPEEQWKALHGLGRIAEEEGRTAAAADFYGRAIAVIESVRAGLGTASLRSEFLADKRDVYDSLIALRLQQAPLPYAGIFDSMERSRARTLAEDRSDRQLSLTAVQSRLSPDTVLLDCWVGAESSAIFWITPSGVGIVRHAGNSVEPAQLLEGVPPARHVIVVPDGPWNLVAFEALHLPDSASLLIERSDVWYLPAARFLSKHSGRTRWLAPWGRELVAFGNPPVSPSDKLAEGQQWQPLPASAAEVRGIARLVAGRAEVHLGDDARKSYLLDHRVEGVPLLHFSTHAAVDGENPDRSRILMAADYLFQQEVYQLDLKGVGLVTVSACDTARGKMSRGEGVQAFSRAFLSAGASATITSLWSVADQSTADFMQQFYYYLSQGQSRAEALRSTKLGFLHANSGLSNPRYWAAFILTGDGEETAPHVITWSGVVCFGLPVFFFLVMAARRWR